MAPEKLEKTVREDFLAQLPRRNIAVDETYHYNEKTGKPVKVNDHCCDSVICAMKSFDDPEAYPRGHKPTTRSF